MRVGDGLVTRFSIGPNALNTIPASADDRCCESGDELMIRWTLTPLLSHRAHHHRRLWAY